MPLSNSFHQLCGNISVLLKWHKEKGLVSKENPLSSLLKRHEEKGLVAEEKRAFDRKSKVRAHTLEDMKRTVSFIWNYSVGQCTCHTRKSPRVQAGRCEAVATVRHKDEGIRCIRICH